MTPPINTEAQKIENCNQAEARKIRTDWSFKDTEFIETDTSVITNGRLIMVLVNDLQDCVLRMGIQEAKRIAEGILKAVAAAEGMKA